MAKGDNRRRIEQLEALVRDLQNEVAELKNRPNVVNNWNTPLLPPTPLQPSWPPQRYPEIFITCGNNGEQITERIWDFTNERVDMPRLGWKVEAK